MNGFTLNEKDLLKQYGQAKQLEIERLLSQYGTSLKDVREMYPQLTTAIEQKRLTTTFPTQPLFFTPSEAAQMGLALQEGWMLKMSPIEGNGGFTSSLITPQKWEITEDDMYISPSGDQLARADMEALLGEPTGAFEATPYPLTVEDLTEEGKSAYQEYQGAGGALDVKGWVDLRERQQLETEQVFGAVFPEKDIQEVVDYINTDAEGFLADIREIGRTGGTEALLRYLIPEITEADFQDIFGTAVTAPGYIPESKLEDAWDAVIAGAMGFKQNIETFLFTNPPPDPEKNPEAYSAWATHTTAIAPEFFPQYAQAQYEQGMQNTIAGYLRRRTEHETFWAEHPELAPRPEYLENPFDNPSLLKDPGYWAYSISSSLAYTLAVMGTIVGVSAVATPFAGIPAGLALAAMPEAGSMIDELVSKGVPIEEATKWGERYGLIAGGIETASDLPFLGLVFKPIKAAVQPMWNTIFRGVASRITKKILTGLVITQTEALEEVFTQVIHNAILKHYDETQSLMEGVSHAYIQATIASTPFGAIGGYASFNTFYDRLSPQMQQQYSGLVERFKDAGLTEQEAQVQAANELAKTTEGEAELSEAIEAAQEEYLEEHPEAKLPSQEPVIPTLPESILQDMRVADEIAKKGVPVTPEVTKISEPEGIKLLRNIIEDYQNRKQNYVEFLIGTNWQYPGDSKLDIHQLENDLEKAGYFNVKAFWDEIAQSKAAIPKAKAEAKEPWQMTEGEYNNYINQLQKAQSRGLTETLTTKMAKASDELSRIQGGRSHRWQVEKALSEGKPVPAEVLADYPDLAVPEIATGKPYTATVYRGYKEGGAPVDEGLFGKGTYYTTNKEYAETYDGKEVMTVNLKNPFVIKTQQEAEAFWNETTRPARQEAINEGKTVEEADELAAQAATDYLKKRGHDGLVARDIIEKGDEIVVFEPEKAVGVPKAEAGMPEAGMQPSMLEEVPAKEVKPAPTGKLVQARMDDYLRLREYNKQATTDRIAEIKKALETKGRSALGLKGNLRLELARLEALQEVDAVKSIQDLDSLIREVQAELSNRELPYHGGARNLFKGYTIRQLEEMLNVYNQARQSMQAEVPALEPAPKPEPSQKDINRVKTDPTPASDEIILQKFIECIKDAKPAREVTEVLKHQELSRRSAIFASILQGGEGYKAFEKAKGALKGFLPQGEYILDLQKFEITDADIERMIDRIRLDNSLRPFEKLNTYQAFTNLVMGSIPTEGELLLLEREFGADFIKAIMSKMAARERAIRIIQDIANIPRTLQTFADLSASLRQGAVLAFGQPVQFATAFKAELKVVFSEKNFKLINEIVHNNVYADSAREHGLYVAPIEEAVRIEAREEAFRGRLIEKVPVLGAIVRASERAYITMLNVLRIETYAYYAHQWEGTGKTSGDYDKLAAFINHATGRGDLGAFSRAGAWLSAAFYSPRFIMSRLQVPLDLINTTPAVRKVVARNLVAFVGTGMMALTLAKLGGAETEDDPRSSDFGKIKIGNTRIDFWAGFQPYVRVITQIINEERKSTRTGEVYTIDPIDVGVYFFRSKLAPMPGLLWDLKSGETFIGEELSAENAEKIIFEKLTPLFIQDLVEAVRDSGIAGVGYGTLALLGIGVQTWSDNWETAEQKLGLPQRGDNLPYTVENAVYDVGDYYSEISRMIGGATYDMLSDKWNISEMVLSVAQAKDIVREINLLPNKRLTSINADPAEGDTFEQYHTQWLARQKITDADELDKFDKDYPKAYLGNMTQAQYVLLTQYHSLPDSQKAEFLGNHPEIYANPREDWLRTHPEENALLVLWDKAKIYSLEAVNKVEALAKSLDIPENALILQDLDAVTQLKLKNKANSDLLDAYSGLDDTFKGPDGLTARDRAIQELYTDNPEFRDDIRRIEALNVGTEANPTLESIVEGWVERGQVVDEFGASSVETRLWLIDNKEVRQWALDNKLLTDDGSDWNENILRLQVGYREDFDLYDSYGDRTSPNYIEGDIPRETARKELLFNAQGQLTNFGTAYYTKKALEKNIPDNLVTTYVDYYGIRKKEGVDYSAGWYEDDWFLIENKDFYDTMVDMGLWQERDFTKIPTREVFNLYQTYYTKHEGQERITFRIQHPELDAWLVYAKQYSYTSDVARDIYSNHPDKFLAYWPR